MKNESGIIPLDVKVLVKPDEAVTKIGSIHIPQTAADKAKYAGTEATLIATGPNAFKEWGAGNGPKPGDRVLFAQYSGARQKGKDGDDFIIMNDEDLICVIEAAK